MSEFYEYCPLHIGNDDTVFGINNTRIENAKNVVTDAIHRSSGGDGEDGNSSGSDEDVRFFALYCVLYYRCLFTLTNIICACARISITKQ